MRARGEYDRYVYLADLSCEPGIPTLPHRATDKTEEDRTFAADRIKVKSAGQSCRSLRYGLL
ncbi:hypothetical protein SAMN04488026_11307 [Aliiruegeria lutimaris]|uniref:Uncharacterized protein n=1 Tax=Aliiruegeria lutimaris TaxID=571298 RepID=A0A1G9NYJ2_9RHOB|nr:hypothetical protein SAMN04488026_11307 [Aliiruegeria lutimaris]